MNLVCVRYFYPSFFDNVEKVFSGLAQKFFVGHFFRIVMPIPHFNSMVSAIGDYGFALEGRMVAYKNCFFRIESRYLKVVGSCNFEKRCGKLSFRCQFGLVDKLSRGFQLVCYGGDWETFV